VDSREETNEEIRHLFAALSSLNVVTISWESLGTSTNDMPIERISTPINRGIREIRVLKIAFHEQPA